MKKRDDLIDEIRAILTKADFYISERHCVQGICFDVVARRDELILIIKILTNVDALKRETSEEIRILASTLGASPLIIGVTSGLGKLEQGVIYSRFGVPILNKETLYDFFIESVPPYIYAAPGGFYVRIDASLLRQIRYQKSISLGTLADIAGVSRRTIQFYCEESGATIEVAMRIEKFLNIPLIVPLNPFRFTKTTADALKTMDELDGIEKDVFRHLKELGYEVLPTFRCPFEALSRDRKEVLLTGVEKESKRLHAKAKAIHSISTVVRRQSVIFVERHKKSRESIEGTPVIGRDEFKKIKSHEKIIALIAERRTDE